MSIDNTPPNTTIVNSLNKFNLDYFYNDNDAFNLFNKLISNADNIFFQIRDTVSGMGKFTLASITNRSITNAEFFYNVKTKNLTTIVRFGEPAQGPPGGVHGGALSMVLDTCMGILCYSVKQSLSVTLKLEISYVSFVPIGNFLVFTSNIEKQEGRKIWTKCTVESLTSVPTLFAESTGLFLEISKNEVQQRNAPKPPVVSKL
eukprot:TRINITY_DN4117_c2_g1_i2.p1 TRINITY_DN4117_c2_g1~~TRINITY_DN4117_c2_g1_i2.p1  ORF type:complete len:203 (+),score=76.33 TRINITY_DN4117_c2_g1_i2:98-706(+)